MYSVTAENSRDAQQGEDLKVTQASHGQSNWLTGGGKPNIAVCVPHTAVLAVQLPKQAVRGATFEQAKQPDAEGNRDFLNFLDGAKERVPLNHLPKQTKVRVLHLHAHHAPATLVIPAAIGEAEGELVGAGVSGGNRRRLSRLFGSD
jgi:hypothetical protein